ncbi:hypothetical protein [Companilactobacillus muriivasis]|uniref:hypothetical protein n=1 Tax=Companilactobacillus muriivasis TaxID=3081444 RepID=UPI0030C731F9
MTENKLTGTARVANHAFLRAMYKDNKGDLKYIDPTGKWNYLDLTQIQGVISGGGDTGDGDKPDHPSIGVDYYPGSLTDGEITERYLLYQRDESVAEDPTTPKTVTLIREVGTKFDMAGDGATFLAHIQKTVISAGAKGAVSEIELNYDTNNVAKEGYFTTTSVYPIYIKSVDLATTNELDVPINGIGENISGKNFLAPHLHIKFNGDGTMTYSSVTGYDNDDNSAGVNGASYEVVVDAIATFSTQEAVAQIPESVNFFSGSTDSDAALAGASNFYENAMDGLELNLESTYSTKITGYSTGTAYFDFSLSDIGLSEPIHIPKDKLIIGLTLNNIFKNIKIAKYGKYISQIGGVSVIGIDNSNVKIMDKSISIDISVDVKPDDNGSTYVQKLRLSKVSTFKN